MSDERWSHTVGRIGRTMALTGLALAIAGSDGEPGTEEEPRTPVQAALRAQELQREALAPVRDALRRSLEVAGPVHVLALSGGGQWGAFGAGFLKGWTESGQRPESFRVVTGTSTGSLIATFAFLGREYDDAVGRAYLAIRGDHDVMSKRFLPFAVLFEDALAGTKPLRRLIETHITTAMVQAVADQASDGRKLYVGSADLDHGVFRAFDLTEIASRGDEDAQREYVDALMASTAIPVAFPPVVIDGRTYVDGGIRRNVFLELVVDEIRKRRLETGAIEEPATVYCLVNGALNVGVSPTRRRVLDIARRSVDILLDESTEGNLLRIYVQAQRAGLRFQMARIPPGMCDAVGSKENQFDPDLMKCLHVEGQKLGRLPEAWTSEPPLDPAMP